MIDKSGPSYRTTKSGAASRELCAEDDLFSHVKCKDSKDKYETDNLKDKGSLRVFWCH